MQLKNFLVATTTLASAVAQDAPTLTSALNSTDNLSTLNSLIGRYPELVATLGNATNITVLAPSNDALQPLMDSPMLDNDQYVMALLSYHVLNMTVMSDMISRTPTFVHTLLNSTMYSNVSLGQVVGARLVGGSEGDDDSDNDEATATIISGLGQRSNVSMADVAVANGVVHIIDTPLTIPENVSATAQAAGLTALGGALTATNLTMALDMAQDITVFAPSNAAFEDIGSILPNLTTEQAAMLLQYHVINGTVAYSSLLENTSLPTMAGPDVNITIIDGEVFVNSARVINPDVLVSGGVVHVIDGVLNPNGTAMPNPDEDESQPAFSGAMSGAVPYTSGMSSMMMTTTYTGLTASTDAAASGYTAAPSGALTSAAGAASSARQSQSSSAGAARQTAAIGAAALFGGAAWAAGF